MKTVLLLAAIVATSTVQAQHLGAEEIEQYRAGAGMGYAKAAERLMRALLTEEQVKRYDTLRGHDAPATQQQHRKH